MSRKQFLMFLDCKKVLRFMVYCWMHLEELKEVLGFKELETQNYILFPRLFRKIVLAETQSDVITKKASNSSKK